MGLRASLNTLLNEIFPRFCLHCGEKTRRVLCDACIEHLVLAPPPTKGAFEYFGPAKTIVKEFRAGNLPHLAPAMAGYMALQMEELQWPRPDMIVPVPERWIRFFSRSYHPAGILAQELGRIWNIPVGHLLKRRIGGFSQSKLSFEERKKLPFHTFQWKERPDISGKIILLVDDLAVTGATLRQCMRRLREGRPAYIFCLAFCARHFDQK